MVPVNNPDGYEFTWNGNRMWRKNRNGRGRSRNGGAEQQQEEEEEVQVEEAAANAYNSNTKQFWPGFQFPGFGGQQQQQQQPGWGGQQQVVSSFSPKEKKVLFFSIFQVQIPGVGAGGWNPRPPQQQRPAYPIGPAGSSDCSGVDPNRNFDIGFGTVGSSSKCSKDTYHGPGPFSEAESM